MTACPNCGAQLRLVPAAAQAAPWVCDNCRRSWWRAELTGSSREHWSSEDASHAGPPGWKIRALAEQERDEHLASRVNLLPEEFAQLPKAARAALVKQCRIPAEFVAAAESLVKS